MNLTETRRASYNQWFSLNYCIYTYICLLASGFWSGMQISCTAGRCVWGNTTWPSPSRMSSAITCGASIATRASVTHRCPRWNSTSLWCGWMGTPGPLILLILPVCLLLKRSCPEAKHATPRAGAMKQVWLSVQSHNTFYLSFTCL